MTKRWILRSTAFENNPVIGTFGSEGAARQVMTQLGREVEMGVWDGTVPERTPEKQKLIDDFHSLYYGPHDAMAGGGLDQRECRFDGWAIVKAPTDLWVYQELIYELKPELIVETGTGGGGSSYFMARMMDIMQVKGQIITIDINEWPIARPIHPRIQQVLCDSTDPELVRDINRLAGRVPGHTMVILDSDHSKEHVLKELDAYHGIVTNGSYLIVEDTNVNGHPVMPDHGPGPWEAVEEWLPKHPLFELDPYRERFLLTLNPHGYLRRIP